MRSTLATQVAHPRDVDDRTLPVFGLVVHTTGSGITEQAKKLKVDPLDHAVAYYLDPKHYFPHYVIGYDGEIVQVADEKERAQHVGFAERGKYLTSEWENLLPAKLVMNWHSRWPRFQSPAHLFPGASPNNVYIGCELLPPFTVEQHKAVVMLAADIGERYKLPDHWWQTPRLVGHSDLNPLTRGEWDPGKTFNWGYVLQLLDARG